MLPFKSQNPELAWGLIASMYLGNMALLAISIFAIPLFVQIIKVPYRILGPIIVVIGALAHSVCMPVLLKPT